MWGSFGIETGGLIWSLERGNRKDETWPKLVLEIV